ncbi:MAG: glycosyltransferase family 2 protein [Bacteroidetes bacterium]|nr:glycosyltransferase family 2 protein [Bacteroidota bacterium]MBL0139359.1 glycosyltransferase family 2 protein [Bacteroidota bacterium]
MPKFFSIIIPTYNRWNYLRLTIDSVLQQTFSDFEIIIVDDGSTDDTLQNLRNEFGSHPLITIVTQINQERGAARNHGLRLAKGEYSLFLDSDDYLFTDHLEVLYTKIKELGTPDFIASKFQFIRENKISFPDVCSLKEGFYDYHLFLNGNPLACNICVRMGNKDLHYFEEDRKYAIKEDWMFHLQNLRHHRLYLIDKITLQMNDHDDRSMRENNTIIIRRTKLAEEWILKNVDLQGEDVAILKAHIDYFMALHSYIDGQNRQALNYLWKAVRQAGFKKKYAVLFMKCVVGNRVIQKIKKNVS